MILVTKSNPRKVYFHSLRKAPFITGRRKLGSFIESLFKKEGKALKELNIIFCSDDYLLKINKDFLNHDFYTDIITFELSETKQSLGEIYISIDRLKQNAKAFNVSFPNEAFRLIIHGALHLCGYKDKSKKDKEQMREMEDFYMKRFLA